LPPEEAGLGLKRCPRASDALSRPERGASGPKPAGERSSDPADRTSLEDLPASV